MHVVFQDMLRVLDKLHAEIKQALEGLPPAALDWTPGPDVNSLAVLIVHATGAERYWVGDVVAREPSDRDRDAEFRVQGLSADALRERLDANLAYARAVFGRLSVTDLDVPRSSPRDGRAVTVGWALYHVLEHTGIHLGHIQVTRQWWEQAGQPQFPGGY